MNIHSFTFNPFSEHCRILWGESGEAVVVDPGFRPGEEAAEFFSFIEEKKLKPCAVLLTHTHRDHTCGLSLLLDRFDVPLYLDEAEKDAAGWKFTAVRDGEIISEGGMEFKVISTPGHTPGSCCFYCGKEEILLSGDTLFAGSIGRTDLDGGDYDKEIVSIMEKLIWLPSNTRVLPGHGPDSTIGVERTTNPFLEPFNEKEED